MEDFNGKVAFITGGGSGVALGQAKVFGKAGCRVVIADIRDDHLAHGLKELRAQGTECHGIRLDITDREAYARAADETPIPSRSSTAASERRLNLMIKPPPMTGCILQWVRLRPDRHPRGALLQLYYVA